MTWGLVNADEQTVERERRATSDLKQRFLAAATLTEAFGQQIGMRILKGATDGDVSRLQWRR
jgi:hypothetical protein